MNRLLLCNLTPIGLNHNDASMGAYMCVDKYQCV